jgi:hypothetical protein
MWNLDTNPDFAAGLKKTTELAGGWTFRMQPDFSGHDSSINKRSLINEI